jgi:gamma-glutamylcysteine synthetase
MWTCFLGLGFMPNYQHSEVFHVKKKKKNIVKVYFPVQDFGHLKSYLFQLMLEHLI